MQIYDELSRRVTAALTDAEIPRLAQGLTARIAFNVDGRSFSFAVEAGKAVPVEAQASAGISISADSAAWDQVLASPPPPTFNSFGALQLANDAFEVLGDPIDIARSRPLLERVIELVVQAPALPTPGVPRDITLVHGSYVPITIDGELHNVYVEQSGAGLPVLFLHTAGADSRQFLQQLSDTGLAESFQMFAVDMPFHGRTLPPSTWAGEPYILTKNKYLSWCHAILRDVIGQPALVVGGSMGAAMSLVLAAESPEFVTGVVAVEPPFRSKGRRNPYQHHVGVHGALHNASYVRGLMSPSSSQSDRRLAAWIYSQGAPGIYTGDLAFYSDEFDGAEVGPRIDARRTPVALLCGEYDYSASPEDGRKLANVIPGAELMVMEGIGHFPMCENADLFRPHLVRGLQHVAGKK